VRKRLNKESFGKPLRILARLVFFVAVMMAIDAIGLSILLYFQGTLAYFEFFQSLILLMLLEGTVITAIGGFLYFATGKRQETRQGTTNPAVSVMVAGILTILIGFLASAVTNI